MVKEVRPCAGGFLGLDGEFIIGASVMSVDCFSPEGLSGEDEIRIRAAQAGGDNSIYVNEGKRIQVYTLRLAQVR